ncbi:MAG: cell wall hydrolase [Lachnospiraceae bacterium]|nr:cell wall hydrolase [Lachnospiraceae bacterium]
MVFLILIQAIFLAGYLCILGTNINQRRGVKSVYEISLNQIVLANEKSSGLEILKDTSSRQRIVTYNVLERVAEAEVLCTSTGIVLTQEDYENLLRIVEAEAGGEDATGKLLVANVVFNRVQDESFPDTVSEVILQQSKGVTQFSPVASGRIWKVEVSEETIDAVNRAIAGEDVSQGALYFAARKHANQKSMRWFDECLEYLFTHGGHEFFKE